MAKTVLAGLVVVVLTGCGSIPSGGEVVAEREVVDRDFSDDDPLLDTRIRRIVQGPTPGAAPDEIVLKFFESHAAKRTDAEPFLSSTAVWPGREALIHAGDRQVSQPVVRGTSAQVTVTVQQRARLTEAGEYLPLQPVAVRLDLTLQRIDGEWRLTKVPPFRLLSELGFRASYRRTKLYFPDPRRGHLVPDVLFLPASPVAARDVVDRLLQGPSAWLAPAVRAVAPEGTRLLGSAAVIRGVVDVDLSLEADRVASEARPALAAQLVRSLTEAGLGVTGVRLLVEGRPYSIPGVVSGRVMTRETWRAFEPVLAPEDPRLYFLRGGNVQVLDGESQSNIVQVQASDFRRIAVSRQGRLLAATQAKSDGREVLLVGPLSGDQRTTVEAESLSTPSWTRDSSHAWVVRRNGGTGDIVAVPAEASGPPVLPVAVEALSEPVHDVHLSPEGNRAVLVVGQPGKRRLLAARVENTLAGPRLTGLRPVAPALTDVSVVTWYDDRGLQVVATQPGAEPQSLRTLFRVDIDGYDLSGERTDLEGLPAPPVAVAAAPTRVTVVEVAGTVYKRVTGRWTVVGAGTAPAYAG